MLLHYVNFKNVFTCETQWKNIFSLSLKQKMLMKKFLFTRHVKFLWLFCRFGWTCFILLSWHIFFFLGFFFPQEKQEKTVYLLVRHFVNCKNVLMSKTEWKNTFFAQFEIKNSHEKTFFSTRENVFSFVEPGEKDFHKKFSSTHIDTQKKFFLVLFFLHVWNSMKKILWFFFFYLHVTHMK